MCAQAEHSFTRDWGVGLAIENGTQLQKAAQTAIEGALLFGLFVRYSPPLWLETQLDVLSVQATMLHGRATTWAERMATHRTFHGRVA